MRWLNYAKSWKTAPSHYLLVATSHFRAGLCFVCHHRNTDLRCEDRDTAPSMALGCGRCHGRAEALTLRKLEKSGPASKPHGMLSSVLSLKEPCLPCVSTGEELCLGLKRGCTLDCPFGFLTDAHNCELCQCRPRPKKCKPTMCDKFCPLGFLYVLICIFPQFRN